MSEHAAWLIPLLIFSARICDVSIGTVRMIMVISGHRLISAGLGFIEVLIWVLAVGGTVGNLDNPVAVLAFAAGYSTGTLVGMTIEKRLAIGFRVVRVINPDPARELAGALREKGYTATRLDGHDRNGPAEIVFVPVRRRQVPGLLDQISGITPDAFLSVERAERVSGFVPIAGNRVDRFPWGRFGQMRK
ncbi:MAG: DUF2179 domain-containing protein [Phycisphaeraceae bacterium]|nr:MAG: DUF2179 domain-containing protein [Phycisphaeraceae bacterium]